MSKSKGAGAMKFVEVSLDDLMPDDHNARVHGERNKKALAESFDKFGAARSIVVDADGKVRAGNGSLEAAREHGIEKAIVIETDGSKLVVVKRSDWTPSQGIAYALADNKTTDLSEFDYQIVAEHLRFLQEADGPCLLDATGFSDFEREPLLASEWKPPAEEPLPEDGRPGMGRPVQVTKEQRGIFDQACAKLRKEHGEDVSEGRCLELICADYLAS